MRYYRGNGNSFSSFQQVIFYLVTVFFHCFWRDKSAVWPKLSAAMRCILAIPATETSSERVFSLAGRTVEERRTQLSADAVDDLLLVHGLKK